MKLSSTLALLTLLPAGVAAASLPQDGEAPAANAGAQEAPALRVGGLKVNGTDVSESQVKRFLIYGPGRMVFEASRINALMEQEWELRVASGEEMERYELPEETYQKAYDREVGQFLERYPTLDLETEIGRAYKSHEWYKRSLRQTLAFDQLFFPDPPKDWPDVTKEAIHAGVAKGQQPGAQIIDLVKDAQENYERRIAWAEANEVDVVPEDEMFLGLLRDYILDSLTSLVEITTATDGLPEDVLISVVGGGFERHVKTQEVFEDCQAIFSQKDVDNTKTFLALMHAAFDQLAEDGALMSEEDHKAKIADLREQLSSSMFNFDFLALSGHQFPSLEAYQMYLRGLESFRRMVAGQLAVDPNGSISPELQGHLPVANQIMGLAKSDAEVLLVSAFDYPNNRWKEDGWAWAEKEASRLKRAIDDHLDALVGHADLVRKAAESGQNVEQEAPQNFAEFWSDMIDLHSEFWDPPQPATGKPSPMQGMKLKGRFGSNTRNDLERQIGESPFVHLLSGESITDTIFFDMDPGTVAGPFKGPNGYYIVYLKQRTGATSPLRMSEPKHVELLREDYVRRKFIEYAHRALAQAELEGVDYTAPEYITEELGVTEGSGR